VKTWAHDSLSSKTKQIYGLSFKKNFNVWAIGFRLLRMARLRTQAGRGNVDVLLSDINMPRLDGMELLRRVHERPNPPEVIMLTGHATVETAIEAMKLGAYDYLTKPYRITELDALVKQAAEKRRLRVDNQRLRQQLARQTTTPEIVFASAKMQEGR